MAYGRQYDSLNQASRTQNRVFYCVKTVVFVKIRFSALIFFCSPFSNLTKDIIMYHTNIDIKVVK